MTRADLARITAWRHKILPQADGEPRQVVRTCRYFDVSPTAFYRYDQLPMVAGAHGQALFIESRGFTGKGRQ